MVLVKGVMLGEGKPPELLKYFKGLETKITLSESESIQRSIGDILGEKLITEELFVDPDVQKILKDNLDRLKQRNICTASFTVIKKDGSTEERKVTAAEGKEVIFFSGSGNELIRILEQTPDFRDNAYCILYDEEKNEGRKQDQLNLCSSFLEMNFDDFNKDGHMEKLAILEGRKKLAKLIAKEKKRVEKFSIGTDGSQLTRTLKSIAEMSRVSLKMLEECKEQMDCEYISQYFHSEQALRLFLWYYAKEMFLTRGTRLVLNIHSERDPCENCTHCLYLEAMKLYMVNPEERIPAKGKSGKKKENLSHGFFQKINHVNYSHDKASEDPTDQPVSSQGERSDGEKPAIAAEGDDAEASTSQFPLRFIHTPYVFVSSQKPEAKGGLARRFLSCCTEDMTILINLDGPTTRLYFRHNGPYGVPLNPTEGSSETH